MTQLEMTQLEKITRLTTALEKCERYMTANITAQAETVAKLQGMDDKTSYKLTAAWLSENIALQNARFTLNQMNVTYDDWRMK